MASYSYITNAGTQRAMTAYGNSTEINITGAVLSSSDLYNSNAASMQSNIQAMTSMPNVIYTAPTNALTYNVITISGEPYLQLKILLGANVGTFSFYSFALILDDNVTPFVIGTYDSAQTKTATNNTTGIVGDVRYVIVNIPFTNLGSTVNLTTITQDNGSVPQLASDAALPQPNNTPYPVYFINAWSNGDNLPALAMAFNDQWYFIPCNQFILDEIGGAFPRNFQNVSNNLTVTNALNGYYLICEAGGIVLTLPEASSNPGMSIGFYNNSSGTITIQMASDDVLVASKYTFNGYNTNNKTIVLPAGDYVCMQADGTSWITFSVSPDLLGFANLNAANTFTQTNYFPTIQATEFLVGSTNNEGYVFNYNNNLALNFTNLYTMYCSNNAISIDANNSTLSVLSTGTTFFNGRMRQSGISFNSADNESILTIGDFTKNSLVGNGYFIIPANPNFIIQWGNISLNQVGPSGSQTTINFPFSFPNACLAMVVNYQAETPPAGGSVGAQPLNTGQFIAINTAGPSSGSNGCYFIAVGV